MPRQKRSFELAIEAKLIVFAFNANAAVRKVERVFAEGHRIGEDITSTRDVSVAIRDAGLVAAVTQQSAGLAPPAERAGSSVRPESGGGRSGDR